MFGGGCAERWAKELHLTCECSSVRGIVAAVESIAVARGARYNPKIKLVAPLARYFMET